MARDPQTTPRSIAPTEDGKQLLIVWEDGAEMRYAPRRLRQVCPCAGCVEEMTGRRTLDPNSVPLDIYPTAIHYVGRYALQPVWSDGHTTGIFSFEYLRGLGSEQD
jgi:ATP-binding protein involved in chromosome partitioning